MDREEMFKKIVDKMMDATRNGSRNMTMEEVATKLDYTREHLSRLYHMKYPISQKHINKLLLTFPELKKLITK